MNGERVHEWRRRSVVGAPVTSGKLSERGDGRDFTTTTDV